MCGLGSGITITVVGAVLVVAVATLGYGFLPGVVTGAIKANTALYNDTEQIERFKKIPFPIEFKFWFFNITNKNAVLAGGIPILNEVGPYVYQINRQRLIEDMDQDSIKYKIFDEYIFDEMGSYPKKETDYVTIANIPYNAVLQTAEATSSPTTMDMVNRFLKNIFKDHNSPIFEISVKEIAFSGVRLCEDPGFIGRIACAQLKERAVDSPSMTVQSDGSMLFSIFSDRLTPSALYEIGRGISDLSSLGAIRNWDGSSFLRFWPDQPNVDNERILPNQCNSLNGTDSNIFAPFEDTSKSIYAFNSDICRSVELRYQTDVNVNGIRANRFASNEWFLSNDEECFCIGVTRGLTKPGQCLLDGAIEMYTCVGAPLVLTYPHFLFGNRAYQNGVLGLAPNIDKHRIFMDLEPTTGTVLSGRKRGQFNVFLRPIRGITATQNLTKTLTPIFWIEEGVDLPDKYVEMLKDSTRPIYIVKILIPVILSACVAIFLTGLAITIKIKLKQTLTDKTNPK